MNSHLTRFMVFLGICVVFGLGIFAFISTKPTENGTEVADISNDGVPFKEVFANFRKTRYETPAELFSAFEQVSKKLEIEKDNLTNYRQDKEDLLSSVATNIFPWADSICSSYAYKWEYIEPCLKICQELKNNKSMLKSSIGDQSENYHTSLLLFSTFEKYKNNKLSTLAKQYTADTKEEYLDLQDKIYSDTKIKNNSYLLDEIGSWKDEFEMWSKLDKAFIDNHYNESEALDLLNEKFSNLKEGCDLLNKDVRFKDYLYYRQQFCEKKDQLTVYLTSRIDEF